MGSASKAKPDSNAVRWTADEIRRPAKVGQRYYGGVVRWTADGWGVKARLQHFGLWYVLSKIDMYSSELLKTLKNGKMARAKQNTYRRLLHLKFFPSSADQTRRIPHLLTFYWLVWLWKSRSRINQNFSVVFRAYNFPPGKNFPKKNS